MSRRRHDSALRVALCLGLCVAPSTFADVRPLDEVLYHATRYANTPERREAKRMAREELKTRMPEALHAAMGHLHGDHIGLQVLVMEWVLELPDDLVVPALIAYLDDERVEQRRLSAFFLGFKEGAAHAAKLTPLLDHEETRGAALRTLGKWKVDAVREPAVYWLREGGERLRVVAANALRDLGDPSVLPDLVAAMKDPVFTVRNAAARAAVSFGDDAVPVLRGQAGEARGNHVRMIRRALHDLGDDADVFSIDGTSIIVESPFFLP
ncbi:MAG TPA: HEAT repeat domain-containing protein [Kiritimatiellia bacterium]|nr:HEAT repeat domain-containing protein [Kiritimatiellia bacterium]